MAIIEVETFELRSDVDAFLRDDAEFQTWSYVERPGILRRTLARDRDEWAIFTWWSMVPLEPDGAVMARWRSHIEERTYVRRVYVTQD